jgi:type IV pilus assembly protein PilA
MPDTATVCPQCGIAVQQAQPPAAAPPAPAPVSVPPSSYPYQAQAYAGEPQTEGKAVGSLILGILSLVGLWLLAGIPAVILGHLAKSSIRKSSGRLKGEGMATAGLIMGYLSVAAIPVILIIAAIAIPSLLRSRMAANQSVAASTLRTVNTSQITYLTIYNAGYARDLATLGPGPSGTCAGQGSQQYACLIDAQIGHTGCTGRAWCPKSGYLFSMTAVCGEQTCTDYVVVAKPANQGSTGERSFCSTNDAVIRFSESHITTTPTVEECQSWTPI